MGDTVTGSGYGRTITPSSLKITAASRNRITKAGSAATIHFNACFIISVIGMSKSVTTARWMDGCGAAPGEGAAGGGAVRDCAGPGRGRLYNAPLLGGTGGRDGRCDGGGANGAGLLGNGDSRIVSFNWPGGVDEMCGTNSAALHFGQLTSRPAPAESISRSCPHLLHVNVISKVSLPVAAT